MKAWTYLKDHPIWSKVAASIIVGAIGWGTWLVAQKWMIAPEERVDQRQQVPAPIPGPMPGIRVPSSAIIWADPVQRGDSEPEAAESQIERMRVRNGVRELRLAESGFQIEEAPGGTYGEVDVYRLPSWLRPKEEKPRFSAEKLRFSNRAEIGSSVVEVHITNDHRPYLVGFVGGETTSLLRKPGAIRKRFPIYTHWWREGYVIVGLAFDAISVVDVRSIPLYYKQRPGEPTSLMALDVELKEGT